jgi:hypothetical protein
MSLKFQLISLKRWVASHRPLVLTILGALLLLIFGSVTYATLNQPLPKVHTEPLTLQSKPKPKYYSPLTGLPVQSESDRTKPITAMIIENSPEARPQSGLKEAEIVYEAITEGGITRFLALYQQNKPNLIGPVRSLRPYFVDWVNPYNASVAHIGGSSAALKEIRNGNYRDIDQFFNAEAYWRASDRYAPHNVYTSFEKLDQLNITKGYTQSEPKEFTREDMKPAPDSVYAATIHVHISSATYDSSYTYDAVNKHYVRSQNGSLHEDREAGVITPKVIVVLNTETSTVFDDTYRQSIQSTGTGKVTIFQGGTVQVGSWHRATRDDQYKFTDEKGFEIKLDRGQTWITAIPNSNGTVSWQ